jgi:hypothetical protein
VNSWYSVTILTNQQGADREKLKLSNTSKLCRLHMGAGLWPRGAALGASGRLCSGLCDWCWSGNSSGYLVVNMTRDDIIAMARASEWLSKYESPTGFSAEAALKFAALVASAEREACAKVCEKHGYDHYCGNVTDKIAETIRARGETK